MDVEREIALPPQLSEEYFYFNIGIIMLMDLMPLWMEIKYCFIFKLLSNIYLLNIGIFFFLIFSYKIMIQPFDDLIHLF